MIENPSSPQGRRLAHDAAEERLPGNPLLVLIVRTADHREQRLIPSDQRLSGGRWLLSIPEWESYGIDPRDPATAVIKSGQVVTDVFPARITPLCTTQPAGPALVRVEDARQGARRARLRRLCSIPVEFSPRSYGGRRLPGIVSKMGKGNFTDLSGGGAKLVADLNLPTGLSMDLKFSLEKSVPVELTGVVVWSRPGPDQNSMGIQFTEASTLVRSYIERWISQGVMDTESK